MMHTEIQLIAVLTAVTCALPGVFLVLRQLAMLSDSITHTILLGIVLAYFITHDLSSPLLLIGAAAVGVLTVWLTEALYRTRLLGADAAIGVVFPLLFSIAVILIARHAGTVHLDTDAVLLGELAFAPFDRLILFGADLGAKAIYVTGALLLLNLTAIAVFFKELQVAAFDPVLAAVLGFSPALLHYGLMTLVSLTAVGAFQAVGSVLVVAFMVAPPAAAYLLTDRLGHMLALSAAIGAANSLIGYHAALRLDVSIAGSMAVVSGLTFVLVFLGAPKRGLVHALRTSRRRRRDFAKALLLLRLSRRERACKPLELAAGLPWREAFLRNILAALLKEGQIRDKCGLLTLTDAGKAAIASYRAAHLSR